MNDRIDYRHHERLVRHCQGEDGGWEAQAIGFR
jgi:hypothetical protein